MKIRLIYSFLLGALSMSAWAQENDVETTTEEVALDEMVITATRRPQQISNIPGTVWVIPKEQIMEQTKSGVPLKEMLGYLIPGLDVGSQGRSNFGQNMRGRAALVMINGVSLNSLRSVSRQFDAIDPFNIERIEVLSGASSIYGGNATGGIINIITKTPPKDNWSGQTEIGGRSGFAGDDDLDFRAAQSVGYKNDKAYAHLGLAYQKNGAIYGGDKERVFPDITQTDLQYNETFDIVGSFGYKFNSDHSVTASLQYYNSEYNGDTGLSLGKNFGAVLTANPDLLEIKDGFESPDRIGTNRYLGTLSYKGEHLLGDQDLYVQVASRGEFLGFYPFPNLIDLGGKTAAYTAASEQNTKYTTAKALLAKDWGAFNLTYGVDMDYENFEAFQNVYDMAGSLASGGLVNQKVFQTNRYPDITSNSYAGFVQSEYKITPKVQLNGGLRYQNMNVEVDDFVGSIEQIKMGFGVGKSADKVPGGESSYDATLSNIGILYNDLKANQAWATYTQGVSLADPAKLYGVGYYDYNSTNANWDLLSSINVNDQPLEGIVTNQVEVGYRTKNDIFKAQISGFYSMSDKNIDIDNSGDRLVIVIEELNLRNLGVETQISFDLPQGFYAGLNALLIKSQVENDDEWQNQSIFSASPSKLTTHLGYRGNHWNARLQNLQSFDLEDEAKNVIDAYNITDLLLSYELAFGQVNLSVQNLFNSDYQTIWSHRAEALYGSSLPVEGLFYFRGRGRTFNLSFTYTF
ncbi:MAG: TonB-dependent receptor [Weeksellaceae bacterium]